MIASDAGDSKLECSDIGKDFAAVVAQVAIFVVGELSIIVAGVLACRENIDHFLWPHWHCGMQHHAVDERENGRVNANGERESQHRDGRKSRRLEKLPQGKFEILDHGKLVFP